MKAAAGSANPQPAELRRRSEKTSAGHFDGFHRHAEAATVVAAEGTELRDEINLIEAEVNLNQPWAARWKSITSRFLT